ncbi:hypothetical protein M0804_010682 [Polistes exclamans]|nr:hypothetical protein M0804_010682 [Polistes exclamans]
MAYITVHSGNPSWRALKAAMALATLHFLKRCNPTCGVCLKALVVPSPLVRNNDRSEKNVSVKKAKTFLGVATTKQQQQ